MCFIAISINFYQSDYINQPVKFYSMSKLEFVDRKIFRDLDGGYSEKELVTLYTQLGGALVWLGEGEEAEKYLNKALDQCSARQVCVSVYYTCSFTIWDMGIKINATKD